MKTLLISDIHGCLEEFEELLEVVKYTPKDYRLIVIGDLVDRGPFSAKVVEKIRKMNVEVSTGNHDNKATRWLKHNEKYLLDGTANPMKRVKYQDYEEYLKLSNEDIQWLKSLPAKVHIYDNYWAIHAGCVPNVPFENQKFDSLIRVRYVDQNGKMLTLPKDRKQPENSYYWTELWDKPYNIIYGHHVHPNNEVRIDVKPNNVCVGIDTGACFGGYLTGFVLEDFEFFKVKAKNTYYKSDVFDE